VILTFPRYLIIKILGIASFAQERIFLDQQVRFSNKIGIYNELTVLRLVRGSLSKDRLSQALRYVFSQHKILRTSLIFNHDEGILKQYITDNDNHQIFPLFNEKTYEHERELLDIIYQTAINPNLFDLASGRVFHCQILQQQKLTYENNKTNLITESDILIIAFHHAAFDRTCSSIFFKSLCNFYNDNIRVSIHEESLQYIDYSVYERQLDMTSSRQFWHSELQQYNFNCPLLLPVDRQRLSTDQRSGLASVAQFTFDKHISTAFLNYASTHHITLFQLGLATFYVFLFKLNHHEKDLCITCLNANRFRVELQNIIGMFVSTLPYRIQLDSCWSFDELVKHVKEKCLTILEHSHYPLQHILSDFHLNQSNLSFLETLFDFIIVSSDIEHLSFDGTSLEQVSLQQSYEVAKFDFSLTFVYNPTLTDNELCCSFVCSRDLFDETSVVHLARRFQYICEQIFLKSAAIPMTESIILINKLSLILPEEAEEIQAVEFRRLQNIGNEGM
jgi:NRPS condensation-like uncharacterized protein